MRKASATRVATAPGGSPVWIHRPLLNVTNVYRWGVLAGVQKMMPADSLHLTLATVRDPVRWKGLPLLDDELVVPAGAKPVRIFAYTIKALTFGHPEIGRRHDELLALFPSMDHPVLRPHVSLYKGGRMPRLEYDGELVFGPERAEEFDARNAMGVKHVRISDHV
jgi:hypothetical protein